jgi:flagellar motor switch protein FliM
VHYFGGDDVPVFMLAVIKKGDRDNLSKAECNVLKKELQGIADAYRTSVKVRAARRRMKL